MFTGDGSDNVLFAWGEKREVIWMSSEMGDHTLDPSFLISKVVVWDGNLRNRKETLNGFENKCSGGIRWRISWRIRGG